MRICILSGDEVIMGGWMVLLLLGSRGGDEPQPNRPTVQSAFGGDYYVRATPLDAQGDRGTTQVYRVGRGQDELLDSYPRYLHGELLLGWSPLGAGWCVVQLEPERGWDPGRLASLAFHCGGKTVRTYNPQELAALGLDRRVGTLVHELPGQFLVHGIEQVANTNEYVLRIERVDPAGKRATSRFDITDGALVPESP